MQSPWFSLLVSFAALWLATGSSLARAEEADSPTAEQAAKKESLRLMLDQARRMIVKVAGEKEPRKCELKEVPLIHYSDQVRRLPESTLWVWQLDGVPVLFCKVERILDSAGATRSWQYCCVPATSQKADVEWKRDFRWRAKEMPFRWTALAEAPAPREQATARLSQMKSIVREFGGETEQTSAKSRQEMRLLASPLHRYAAPQGNVIDGAVFGLTSNGTNPDVLLIVETLREPESKARWRYAIVGLTGDAVKLTRGEATVWTKPFSEGPGDHRSWMWYVTSP